ncbi:sugar ABC transporter permease [Dictyobacter sp. S3.2.2.5]|uniref:Sugar ABC transporter permease n=1 Tax=Dictyobacter halimunensis TaxID=3026934 RepID=A0ABQ6FLV8_9CHLR|nr:sugar ABC transporter permease [Dictyobacter sp. S3.2.2.5]
MAIIATKPGRNQFWQRKRTKHALIAYLFITPSFLGVLIFIAFPVLFALYMSLQQWDGLTAPQFIGLDNYISLFKDPIFWVTFRNTIVYTIVTVPIGTLISMGVAQLLNQRVLGLAFFRTIMFIPVVTSGLAIAVIWKWIYDYDNGLINDTLTLLHLPQVPWLSDPTWALIALCIIGIWQGFGFTTILILAAIQNVPDSLQEASAIDGASAWRRFWQITVPLIIPTLLFVTIISFVGSFQVFTQIYYLTNGGPDYGTSVLTFLVFQRAFVQNRFGEAAALSYVMFAIIFAVTMLQMRLSRNSVNAAAEFEV